MTKLVLKPLPAPKGAKAAEVVALWTSQEAPNALLAASGEPDPVRQAAHLKRAALALVREHSDAHGRFVRTGESYYTHRCIELYLRLMDTLKRMEDLVARCHERGGKAGW